MQTVSERSPLSITEKALEKIEYVRFVSKIPDGQYFRVMAHEDFRALTLGFDILFDGSVGKTDRVYTQGKTQGKTDLILDNKTAYHLIGSVLDLDDAGDFRLIHLNPVESITDIKNIVFD